MQRNSLSVFRKRKTGHKQLIQHRRFLHEFPTGPRSADSRIQFLMPRDPRIFLGAGPLTLDRLLIQGVLGIALKFTVIVHPFIFGQDFFYCIPMLDDLAIFYSKLVIKGHMLA